LTNLEMIHKLFIVVSTIIPSMRKKMGRSSSKEENLK
jgi:hypothetical protein